MLFINAFMCFVSLFYLQNENISFHLESKTLAKNKVIIIKADVYYKFGEGKMITHYTHPFESTIISNRKGEAQVYDSKTNTVSLQRGLLFSTNIDIVNLFLTDRYADMGLKEMNFKMISSKNDKGYILSTWVLEKAGEQNTQKIELAHEKSLPVYMAIYDNSGKINKKVFYSNYSVQGQYYIPVRITEITYIPNGDSLINKKEYSLFKNGFEAQGSYFDFVIPQNAKVSK